MTDPTSPAAWHPIPRLLRQLAASTPYAVLLETAKQESSTDQSLLFLNPIEKLTASTPHELHAMLDEIDRHVAAGAYIAGFFSYECGEHFIGLPPRERGETPQPLAWAGVFTEPAIFHHATGEIHGSLAEIPEVEEHEPAQIVTTGLEVAEIVTNGLEIPKADYDACLAKIDEYLHAGDTYQVNFTDRVQGRTGASPLALYETLLQQQPVPYAAFVNLPGAPLLSFSPELFFRIRGERIHVRPMKGTWPRGVNNAGDIDAAEHLRSDEKNRSEHVMIVDLLRNDLGRICEFGSIAVDDLFRVERYNTLFQMTSTCSGRLRAGWTPSEVLTNLFPSGSITGAPKRRTMEIIRELECHPRGAYTGAIGYFGPGNFTGDEANSENPATACFNVAIRTVALAGDHLTMGVGGGITADSDSDEEFAECTLKAAFLTQRRPAFSLIETMRCERGIALLPLHLERLTASAEYFGIHYNAAQLEAEVNATAQQCGAATSRVRLLLHQSGEWTIAASPLNQGIWNGRLRLSTHRTNSADIFLHHKTTNRSLYESELASARSQGFDEVLFANEQGLLTEGAISNLYVQMAGKWFTPRLHSGVLPGVHRTHILNTSNPATDLGAPCLDSETWVCRMNIEEQDIPIEDLAKATSLYLGNALRGLRQVHIVETPNGKKLYGRDQGLGIRD